MARRILSVFALLLFNAIVHFDRYAAAGVLPLVQSYYSIGDSLGGLIQTLSMVVYALTLLLLSLIGDRINSRRMLIAISALWFLCTVSSFVVPPQSFWLYLILRSLAMVGPSAAKGLVSVMLFDLFPTGSSSTSSSRSSIVMFYFVSSTVGISASTIFSSWVVSSSFHWSIAHLVVVPFAFVTILSFFFILPKENEHLDVEVKYAWKDYVRTTVFNRTYVCILANSILCDLSFRALAWWGPTFRLTAMESVNYDVNVYHGISYVLLRTLENVSSVVATILATLLWTQGLKVLNWTGRLWSPLVCVGILISIGYPIQILSYYQLTKEVYLALMLESLATLLTTPLFPTILEAIFNITPRGYRVFTNSTMVLVLTLLSDGPSSYIVGLVSDIMQSASDDPSTRFLAIRLAIVSFLSLAAVSSLFLFLAAIFYERDKRTAEEKEEHIEEITPSYGTFQTQSKP